MEEKVDEKEEEVIESGSSDSAVDSDDDETSSPEQDVEQHYELQPSEPLTDQEVEDLISEFLDVESKAPEAQEALEKESLAKLKNEVREELGQTLSGDELEKAVADEMDTFREEWEGALDGLETESAHLLEQLDGAGIELPSLFKWIESKAPSNCSTDAWRKRTHWIGSQVSSELIESVAEAEKYLQSVRPVRRRHGRVLEEGASGFLEKKIATDDDSKDTVEGDFGVDWSSLNKVLSDSASKDLASFGSKHWASVYLASTPQQAAQMGLNFPGVDEVEEIDDIEANSSDPFVADVVANENEIVLSEEQKRNFRKVKEEDDANLDMKLQLRLKRRRNKKRFKQVVAKEDGMLDQDVGISDMGNEVWEDGENNENDIGCPDERRNTGDGSAAVISDDATAEVMETRNSKRMMEDEEPNESNKRSRTVITGSDDEAETERQDLTKLGEQPFDKTGISAESSPPRVNLKFQCTACSEVTENVVCTLSSESDHMQKLQVFSGGEDACEGMDVSKT